MRLTNFLVLVMLLGAVLLEAAPQETEESNEPAFQLPVQLIGFPVIIMAVKFSNFLKKLTYTLNPRTYVSRSRRAALTGGVSLLEHVQGGHYDGEVDIEHVEQQLVAEMGPDVCLFEDICQKYAAHAGHHTPQDWEDVVRKFKTMAGNRKKFYLLSVFLGDIVSSPKLCHQVAMRPGRACK